MWSDFLVDFAKLFYLGNLGFWVLTLSIIAVWYLVVRSSKNKWMYQKFTFALGYTLITFYFIWK